MAEQTLDREQRQSFGGPFEMISRTRSILITFLATLLLLPPSGRGQADTNDDSLPFPEINFGGYFYMSFPNGTLDKLYECLCDMQIIKCNFSYTLRKTSFGFPYLYTVTNVHQDRAASNVSRFYRHAFLCDFLKHFPEDDMICFRQTASDDTCDRSVSCIVFSVQLNSTKCSSQCILMVSTAPYNMTAEYYNFGDRPRPVKDGTCPTPDAPSSSVVTTSSVTNKYSTNVIEMNDTSTGSIADAITTSGGVVNSVRSTKGSKSLSPLPYIGAGVGAFFFIVAIATYSGYMHRKRKLKDSTAAGPVTSNSEISASNSSRSLPDNHTNNDEEADEAGYQTLDEVVDGAADAEQAPECDADGYNIIRDCAVGHDCWTNTDKKRCRPLPEPPESDGSVPGVLTSAGTLQSSMSLPASSLSKTASLSTADHSLPNDQSRPQSHDRPNPTPHKRQAEPNQIEHMGVVNLKSGHHALSGHTQVRLVRTPWGDMELITLESDLPVFTEYYSRLQLVSMKDDGLGVVGVSTGQADSDSHKYFDVLETQEPVSKQSLQSTQHEQTDSASYTRSSMNSHLYIFYFGFVELTETATVSPCDYLTVLDIDPEKVATANSGYLTVLDIGCSSSSNGSQVSVKSEQS
ncbi:hypothetical protein PoB_003443600 [Plakobranchus ocellatus]|uniref:Uncharacterized protein n=1 Tax=Plakobranchus ocellatus TaxID=259542 RepID=A0AAV4A9R8_9GAST|nr:hypothetical protein PoB_003443600 [Plakobranchus ocellatus]